MLPNYALALGAKLVPIDVGMKHRLDIWLTYHPDLRNSYPHMLVMNWLRQIFDGRRFPCFDEEFIHPLDLIPLMADTTIKSSGEGFAAANPIVLRADQVIRFLEAVLSLKIPVAETAASITQLHPSDVARNEVAEIGEQRTE
jgi:hypothetical protein